MCQEGLKLEWTVCNLETNNSGYFQRVGVHAFLSQFISKMYTVSSKPTGVIQLLAAKLFSIHGVLQKW